MRVEKSGKLLHNRKVGFIAICVTSLYIDVLTEFNVPSRVLSAC